MTALPTIFQDNRPYRTEWFQFPDGTVKSYRWFREDYKSKRAIVERAGGVLLEDPFRKGAPLGGYSVRKEVA